MDITTDSPRCRLLDLTRLMSRVGRGAATGVDRVEAAYLDELLRRPDPCFFLIRTGRGYLLLDRAGGMALRDRFEGRVRWGRADLTSLLSPRLSQARKRAESDARRLCFGRCGKPGLTDLVAQALPTGVSYLNVGLANLDAAGLAALGAVPGLQIAVMIHDTIPLDFPQFQAPGSVERFRARLTAVATYAALILCNSEKTRADVQRHLEGQRQPPMLVAHLGVTPAPPDPGALPTAAQGDRPGFVVLGTIEPRKNHMLLFRVWEKLAEDQPPEEMPLLHVIGHRGWNNAEVFDWLEVSPLSGRFVLEYSNLTDGAVTALLQKSRGLLFPSHAEGFGLPLVEAAALGVPVIAAPLEVFREILGDYPVYLPMGDSYSWVNEIKARLGLKTSVNAQTVEGLSRLLGWSTHFDAVFRRI
ncbi:hypothetical protein BV394_09250 [Brevirhabdus pacifica]|uniref:Uncharacterized protein n=1 Tax=Brevirhabdus pacifica TaxID=1267768 RepID=A0A1U7DJ34_9RHOB|nr:glycosyltransferase family 1 protein [Brevirhabdus pacifica]APX89878.1 hypothetical protein BV394_09250 [Brevirhabdus pacifica]PJJ82900.1 glycosyl transferase family 1 [Brevirhabdus pacifica]